MFSLVGWQWHSVIFFCCHIHAFSVLNFASEKRGCCLVTKAVKNCRIKFSQLPCNKSLFLLVRAKSNLAFASIKFRAETLISVVHFLASATCKQKAKNGCWAKLIMFDVCGLSNRVQWVRLLCHRLAESFRETQ